MSVDTMLAPATDPVDFFSRSFDSSRSTRSGPFCKIKKAASMDEGTPPTPTSGISRGGPFAGSIKRKSLRRRASRKEKPEEKTYGNDTAKYEAIRVRVLQEKAVVNAIEALQERWRMIMFMYHDCQDLNEGRIERQQTKLTIKRQEELILIIIIFLLMCLPIAMAFVFMCR